MYAVCTSMIICTGIMRYLNKTLLTANMFDVTRRVTVFLVCHVLCVAAGACGHHDTLLRYPSKSHLGNEIYNCM